MLAIQRPSMGSSKPPNQSNIFGYNIDDSATFPFDGPPPEPAPGSSLLSDGDNKALGSFFDHLNANDFGVGGSMFTETFGANEDLGFDWSAPPQFVGSSTSFGQQPHYLGNNVQNMSYPGMNGHAPSSHGTLPQVPSADVLAAAATLHNGHNGQRSHSIPSAPMFPNNGVSSHPRPQSMMMFNNQSTEGSQYFDEGLMFGTDPGQKEQPRRSPQQPVGLGWGTDSGFGAQFIPPTGQDELARVHQNQKIVMECLVPESSTAGNTRANSPVFTRRPTSQQQNDHPFSDDESRPTKRKKSEIARESDDEISQPKPQKKRRPKAVTTASSTSAAAPQSPPNATTPISSSKRRKSVVSSVAKPTRENLTEGQKRENHIKSEQKRRTLIKEGFDDLNELVPDLKSGGFSKSAVLTMAGDFLQGLVEGNGELRRRLKALGG